MYEAYVIYLFVALMLAYLRESDGDSYMHTGDRKAIQFLEKTPPLLFHPFPCSLCCCGAPIPRGADFLRFVKFGVLQYSFIRPICTVAVFIMELQGLYDL